MSHYRLTPEAEEDLFQLWAYIARDNLDAANRVEAAVYEACDFLASHPFAGRLRADLAGGFVRFWAVSRFSNYLIVYKPASRPLAIVRILHGARTWLN